jgi:hypothetical protein
MRLNKIIIAGIGLFVCIVIGVTTWILIHGTITTEEPGDEILQTELDNTSNDNSQMSDGTWLPGTSELENINVFTITRSSESQLIAATSIETQQELDTNLGGSGVIAQDNACGGSWTLLQPGSIEIYQDSSPSILNSLAGTRRYVAEVRNIENGIVAITQCHSLTTFESQQDVISELERYNFFADQDNIEEVSPRSLPEFFAIDVFDDIPYTKAYRVDTETEFGRSSTYVAFTDFSVYMHTTVPNDGIELMNPTARFVLQEEVRRD